MEVIGIWIWDTTNIGNEEGASCGSRCHCATWIQAFMVEVISFSSSPSERCSAD